MQHHLPGKPAVPPWTQLLAQKVSQADLGQVTNSLLSLPSTAKACGLCPRGTMWGLTFRTNAVSFWTQQPPRARLSDLERCCTSIPALFWCREFRQSLWIPNDSHPRHSTFQVHFQKNFQCHSPHFWHAKGSRNKGLLIIQKEMAPGTAIPT